MDPNVFIYGVLTAFLSIFLNYCLGKPGSEKWSPYEIFSGYTVWLAKMRLKRARVWNIYEEQIKGHARSDQRTLLYEAAIDLFTWERAVGMCVICAGFWISLICGILYTFNLVSVVEIILISHITIRILAKLI